MELKGTHNSSNASVNLQLARATVYTQLLQMMKRRQTADKDPLTPSSWDSGLLTTRSWWPLALRGLVMCCKNNKVPGADSWSLQLCRSKRDLMTRHGFL